jgi:Laminin B (Domain IV)/FlgD Ig-like domain
MRPRPPFRSLRSRITRQALTAVVFAISWAAAPASATNSTFDTSNEGWAIVSYPFQSHVAEPGTAPLPFDGSFGHPPGSVRVGDVFGETGVSAPAAFLGDKSASYGDTLTYDIFLRFTDHVAYPAVVLNGGTMSLYYDALSPALNTWEHQVVPLSETGWRVSDSGLLATQGQFQAVLQNLVGLYIYTEWNTGDDDTNVDNVNMGGAVTAVTQQPPATVIAMKASPNPFKRSTSISFMAPRAGSGDLKVLTVAGQVVRRLTLPAGGSGKQTIVWDGMDHNGAPVPSGIYYCLVGSASDRAVLRLALLR